MTWAPVRFFWQHSLHDLTATSVASGFDVSNLLNSLETDYWKGTSVSTQAIVFDAGSGQTINADYFAIAQHNLKTAGAFVELQTFSGHIIYTNSWSEIACGATERSNHTAVKYNNEMYIFGRLSAVVTNDFWNYSFVTSAWMQLTNGATGRYYHSSVVFSNEMYVFGGINYQTSMLNDLWKYSFPNCTWTEITCGTIRRHAHSAVVFSDAMYVFGGYSYQNCWLNDLWKYSFTSCTWTEVQCGATRREFHTAVVFSDAMYVFGGYSYQGSRLNDLWKYSFTSCTWTEVQCGATRRSVPSAVVFSNDMYIFGGFSYQSCKLNDFWKYSFTSCAWTQAVSGATRRSDHSAVVFSDSMYVFGGFSELNSKLNDLWKCSLSIIYSNYIDASSSYYGPAIPPDNNLLLALVNSAQQRAWRMIISSAQTVPYIAIAQWGMKQDLGYMDLGIDPNKQSRKANVNVSQTGYLQGIHELYTERQIDLNFSDQDSGQYAGVSSWWDGNRLRNFFLQWESSAHSSEIWLMHPDPDFEAPMKVGGLYRDIKITLRGRKVE